MKKLVLLATAALVAMLILVPTVMAQGSDSDVVQESTTMSESTMMDQDLPTSGGLSPSVLLPASALVLGSGILAYGLLRRR